MRILAVNWLDLDNPQAGGAEVHFFQIFRRLVRAGDTVTLITSGWPGAAPQAMIDGIAVRRFGGRQTFALRGRGAVRAALAEAPYDIVVEDINKLPLFLPTLTPLPMYVIIPHLFGTTAFREAPWPVAATVWLAERPVPRVYRRAAFHAISESTRDDLVDRGIPASRIRVIYPGVDSTWFTPDPATPRAERPTFLYVGRLKRYKGIDLAIAAVAAARNRGMDLWLDVAGQGDDRDRLVAVARRLQITDRVAFLGYVDEERKRDLLRRSWAAVLPSEKEGWGITNVEAAACGTPAIAANRPGLRESVRDGETGLLVPYGDVGALADAMVRLARTPELVDRFGRAGRAFAKGLTWESAAEATRRHLEDTIRAQGAKKGRPDHAGHGNRATS